MDLSFVSNRMRDYPRPWWVAGGWAVDLHLGRQSRAHHDIDIALLRSDQIALRRYLPGWNFYKVVNGVRSAWFEHEILELPIHEVYAESGAGTIEFLFNEAAGDHWLFRRNQRVSMPFHAVTRRSATGIPYLCPEIALLYKAKSPRAVDRKDFAAVLPTLNRQARRWLSKALEECHSDHEWLAAVRTTTERTGENI